MRLSAPARLPTKFGTLTIRAVEDDEGREHAIVYKGTLANQENVPLRVHSECLTGEVLHSLRCDCKEQLESALAIIEAEECGLLIYLRQEGRGIGFFNKIEAYALQDKGYDTIEANARLGLPADTRTYEVAAAIISHLRIRSIRLLTNNPNKLRQLESHGIRVVERLPLRVAPNGVNARYLQTKLTKMHHIP